MSSPKRGSGTKKGQKKEGRAGGWEKKRWEKVMISFWAARGSPGSQVITQGSEEDPTIIDSSRRNGAADTATVFKLVSRQIEGRIRYGPQRDT